MTNATDSWSEDAREKHRPAAPSLALLIAASTVEPQRVGQVGFVPPGPPLTLGRGEGDGEPRIQFVMQRPGKNVATPPLGGVGLSRDQIRVTAKGERLEVQLTGRAPITHLGDEVERCSLQEGDVLVVRRQLVLLCVRRPKVLPALVHFPDDAMGAFGAADRFGMIGESPIMWQTREQIAFAAKSGGHALLLGETGTGKELAARAFHALSSRADGPLVARNAATFPPDLIDAELFGHAKNYPTAGMQERHGLVGEADGGTLFLDEIGEIPSEMQSHLLRVLDADGEYQRLGDSARRRSRFVFVGATNRDVSVLKPDLLARLSVRAMLPPLRDRAEDIPLLLRNAMLESASNARSVVEPFIAEIDGQRHARVHPDLVSAMLEHDFPTNVRGVERILWSAMQENVGETTLFLTPGVRAVLTPEVDAPKNLTAAQIRDELERHGGSVTKAANALGLPSRYALYRWMKKLGVE